MRIILSILLILSLLVLPGCFSTNKVTLDQHEQAIKDLSAKVSAVEQNNNNINKSLAKYTTGEVVDKKIADSTPDQQPLLNKIDDLQKQIDALKAQQQGIPIPTDPSGTPIPTPTPENKVLSLTILKAEDTISKITTKESNVSFTVKITNLTGSRLDNIVIIGSITCNRDLDELSESYPILNDLSNGTLIYDFSFDGSRVVDFSFYKSTGSPTVYLNPGETLIFHPRLLLKSDEEYEHNYKFTLTIDSYEGDVK